MVRSQSPNPFATDGLERVAVDYSYPIGKDPKGKTIYRRVAYVRVGPEQQPAAQAASTEGA